MGALKRWCDQPGAAWVFGVMLPIAMMVLDPTVFRATTFGGGTAILGRFRAFGYTGIALGVVVMLVSLLSTKPRAPIAGALAGGSIFSLTIGIAILPASLVGVLLIGVGLLGFTPFLSALVFSSRAAMAYREAPAGHRRQMAAFGVFLFLAIPITMHMAAASAYRSAVKCILSGGSEGVARGVLILNRWKLFLDADQLVETWSEQPDARAKANLATAYRRVFGDDIASRAVELLD